MGIGEATVLTLLDLSLAHGSFWYEISVTALFILLLSFLSYVTDRSQCVNIQNVSSAC